MEKDWSPCEGNFKPLGDKAFPTIVHGRLVQGAYAWLGTFPRQYYIMSGNSIGLVPILYGLVCLGEI